jgi:hypothetical protein
LSFDLSLAEQLLRGRRESAVGEVVAMIGVELEQHLQEPLNIFRVTAMHDVETHCRERRAMKLRRSSPNDDERDTRPRQRREKCRRVSDFRMRHARSARSAISGCSSSTSCTRGSRVLIAKKA